MLSVTLKTLNFSTQAVPDGKAVSNYLLELIRDCFRDTVLIYNTDDDRKSYAVTVSVLSPILWNILYDGVLKLKHPKGAPVIEGKRLNELVMRNGQELDRGNWSQTCQ